MCHCLSTRVCWRVITIMVPCPRVQRLKWTCKSTTLKTPRSVKLNIWSIRRNRPQLASKRGVEEEKLHNVAWSLCGESGGSLQQSSRLRSLWPTLQAVDTHMSLYHTIICICSRPMLQYTGRFKLDCLSFAVQFKVNCSIFMVRFARPSSWISCP